MERKNAWKSYTEKDLAALEQICDDYMDLISRCKTEREWTRMIVSRLEQNGYKSLEQLREQKAPLTAGAKIYTVQMGKAVLSFHLG